MVSNQKKLRWRMEPKQTGLRAIGAAPRGHEYHDGTDSYARVSPNGGGWRSEQNGWYWVAFGQVPYINTASNPVSSVEEAKRAAECYVKEHLQRKNTKEPACK